jgi:cell division protein FtsW
MSRKLESDKILFGVVLGLVLLGLLMVYSATAELGAEKYHSAYHFILPQLAWAVVGLAGMAVLMNLDYRRLRSPMLIFPAMGAQLLLLIVALLTPASHNAHRWVRLQPLSFEPSELSKLVLVLFLAYFLDLRKGQVNDLAHTVAPLGLLTGLTVALILKQPDLGTALAILFTVLAMFFTAGARLVYFLVPVLASLPMFYFFVYRVPWRWSRMLVFFDPTLDPLGKGFQPLQAKMAVATGGIMGVGLMEGREKLFYLPDAHNDYIFGVISEEMGFVGAVLVVALFAIILWRGLRAARCRDNFGRLLAIGLTALIVGQALVNMSVVLSLLPAKGLPLPFVSCGGSALLIDLLAAGILINISQHGT